MKPCGSRFANAPKPARIADALLDRAEQGNLPSAREIVLTEGLRRQLTFTIFRTSES
jgi:hypothetical protein